MKAREIEVRGAVAKLWRCRDKEVLMEGPARTGKSAGTLFRILELAETYPGSRIALARKYRATLAESIQVTWENFVLPQGHEARGNGSRSGRKTPYTFSNGSEVVLLGFDDSNKWLSTEFDLVYCNEATEITEADWETALSRLSGSGMPFKQAIADCNPRHPSHWLNKRALRGEMTRLRSRHEDNPRFFSRDGKPNREGDELLAMLDRMTGVRKARLRYGEWVAEEGTVFEGAWDTARNLIDPPAWMPYLTDPKQRHKAPVDYIIVGVDWGYHPDPAVFEVFVKTKGKRPELIRVRELYRHGMTIDRIVEQAKRIAKDYGDTMRDVLWVPDPSRPGHIEMFRNAGLRMVGGPDDKPDGKKHTPYNRLGIGIDRLKERLGDGTLKYVAEVAGYYGDGKTEGDAKGDWLYCGDPELEAMNQPMRGEEEFTLYAWPPYEPEKLANDKPVDKYNHCIDASRYAVVYSERYDLSPVASRPKYRPGSLGEALQPLGPDVDPNEATGTYWD